MAKGGKVDLARCSAAGALDLEPRKAAVDGLVDGGGRVYRLTVRPHPLVPAFAGQLVGLPDQRLALGPEFLGLLREDRRHRAGLAELLAESLAVTSGERGRVIFRRDPGIQTSGTMTQAGEAALSERWPAAVIFTTSGPRAARVVQQTLADVLPDRMLAVKPDGVGHLDLDGAVAALAGNPQHVAGYLGQAALLNGDTA